MLETVKYGVGEPPIMPLTSNEFLEEPCSKIHIFFKDVYNFVSDVSSAHLSSG
jgi:hypothetical protein